MLGFITIGTPTTGILQLKEIRFRQVDTCCVQCRRILLLKRLANHEVNMVQSHSTIPCKGILDQGIRIFAMCLLQAFVLLGQVYTVTLDPGRNPNSVVGTGRAIGKIELISQIVLLAIYANHLQQVYVGRASTHETVYNRLTTHQVIDQQGVHG